MNGGLYHLLRRKIGLKVLKIKIKIEKLEINISSVRI